MNFQVWDKAHVSFRMTFKSLTTEKEMTLRRRIKMLIRGLLALPI